MDDVTNMRGTTHLVYGVSHGYDGMIDGSVREHIYRQGGHVCFETSLLLSVVTDIIITSCLIYL